MTSRIARVLIVFGLAASLAACQTGTPPVQTSGASAGPTGGAAPLKVLAVENFLADIVQNVAGDRATVTSLIPIGVDPHAFEPTPQDVAQIADAGILAVNGGGFEEWLQETLDSSGTHAQVIDASAGLVSRTAREGEAAEMSAADLVDSLCAETADGQANPIAPAEDGTLAEEQGLYALPLQADPAGGFRGEFHLASDENSDFQIGVSGGEINLSTTADGQALTADQTLDVSCSGLVGGWTYHLSANTPYTLTVSGATADSVQLFVGPAGGQHHHESDPHFWLDPNEVITYVQNIRDGLIQADPAGKDEYTRNADAYIAKLHDLDKWIQSQVETIPTERRLLVTNHESLGYFADRYGFRVVGTVIPSVTTGADPSAQQVARLVERIRAVGAPAIFLETGANPKLAQQVADETGVKMVAGLFTHSLSPAGGDAPTYLDMMRYNVQAIVAALK